MKFLILHAQYVFIRFICLRLYFISVLFKFFFFFLVFLLCFLCFNSFLPSVNEVLPPASAASAFPNCQILYVKVFYVISKALTGELCYPVTGLVVLVLSICACI